MRFWTNPEGLAQLGYELFNSPNNVRLKITNAYIGLYGPRIMVKLSKRQVRKLMATPSKQDIESVYGI